MKNSHRISETRLYQIYTNMLTRCNNPHNEWFSRYGGRGIKVCSEWENSFQAFEDWAYSNGYREYLTIDRIDNNKGYEPENCRWCDQSAQMRNTSKTVIVDNGNKRISLYELSEACGIPARVLADRYRRGDRGERLTRPVYAKRQHKDRLFTINGVSQTAKAWASAIGISESMFYLRVKQYGLTEEVLKPSRNKKKRVHPKHKEDNGQWIE